MPRLNGKASQRGYRVCLAGFWCFSLSLALLVFSGDVTNWYWYWLLLLLPLPYYTYPTPTLRLPYTYPTLALALDLALVLAGLLVCWFAGLLVAT